VLVATPETLTGPPLDEAAGIGSLTLGGFLREVCARFRDNEALVFDDPLAGGSTVRWTYGDLEQQARRIGRALLACGIGKGARVGILMANRPEAVASLFGAALAGAVAVPLSTFAPKPELSYVLAHSDVTVLLLQACMGARRFARPRPRAGPSGMRATRTCVTSPRSAPSRGTTSCNGAAASATTCSTP
jgi:fatty-acyl-CoA synthase